MIIYTDGSSRGNPGPGGFGVVVLDDNEQLIETYSNQEEYTTNNRQELKAIVYAMIMYGKQNPTVYSDSAYAVNTFNTWMFSWANNDWIKSDKKQPENLDLIQGYYQMWLQGYRINLKKVAGHKGNKWNEMADALATSKLTPTLVNDRRKNE